MCVWCKAAPGKAGGGFCGIVGGMAQAREVFAPCRRCKGSGVELHPSMTKVLHALSWTRPRTVPEIARMCGIHRSWANKLLKRLEAKGVARSDTMGFSYEQRKWMRK